MNLQFIVLCWFINYVIAAHRPHIIFILADDLGWNDVGFHGSNQIPTPNIDALAYSGLILDKYYVMPICTPSRSALMTGKHPIHTGMQHGVLKGAEPRGLPLDEKLLPEYLKELGYKTHIVGKWHLGFYKKEFTPTCRGFDSHVGYWSGHHDYFDHTAVESPYWGLDMRRGLDPAWEYHGQYSTDIFTKESIKLIDQHNTSEPLFLYIAHAAVHSGNPYNPLPVPDEEVAKFTTIEDYNRRKYAGILTRLDKSVGQIVDALKRRNILKDSLIVFSTDNGGAAAGFNLNAASNWPLRGVKNTPWEGGVKGTGLIWSPHLLNPGRISKQMFHITDWLPTLLSIAGTTDINSSTAIDGIDLWPALQKDTESPRKIIIHNIDDIFGYSSIMYEDWKLVQGTTYEGRWDSWYGPSGRESTYDIGGIMNSLSGRAITGIGMNLTSERIRLLRADTSITCGPPNDHFRICNPLLTPCLFNIREDPCEKKNLASEFPTILKKLQEEIKIWNASAVQPGNLPWNNFANPELWDHVWTNFGDYEDVQVE